MRKEEVTFYQLTAGALFKFGRLDSVDMTLLINDIRDKYEIVNDVFVKDNDYFVLCNGMIILNDNYINRFYKTADIENMQGSVVKEYMDNLDMTLFTLRKIKLLGLGCVVKDALEETFNEEQMDCIEGLYQNGFIEDYIQEDARYGDYVAVRLTQEGKIHLFKIDNKNVIEAFLNIIRCNGYNDDLFDNFLLEQDLDKNCYELLTSKNYSEFCWKRLKNPKTLGYSRTRNVNKK